MSPKENVAEAESISPNLQEQVIAILGMLAKSSQESTKVQAEQLEQTKPKSIANPPRLSVYNPRGEKDFPMPLLKCEVSCPWPLKPDFHNLTREEVELWNLMEPGIYNVEKNDGSVVQANVLARRNQASGKLEAMEIVGPIDPSSKRHTAFFGKDSFQQFPSMVNILRQMLAQHSEPAIGEAADAVMSMKEEVRRIALPADNPKCLPISIGR